MGVLTCSCLNVSVHYKGALWSERTLCSSQLFPEGTVDPLTNQPLYEIELDVAGIVVEHKALMVTRKVGDWVIHRCSNCETDVYVLHLLKELSRVFVTKNLEGDSALLRSRDGYSQVFKIVLRGDVEAAEIDGFRRKRVSSMTFGKEDQAFNKIHSLMKDFLNHEQVAMEERVRRYEDEQRSAFAELQGRAHSDRALLFAAINRAAEKGDANTIGRPTPPAISAVPTVPPRSSPTKKHITLVVAPKHSSPLGGPSINMRESPPPPEAPSQEALQGGDDMADFFMLDGSNGEGDRSGAETSAFLQSSDDETSTDDSSYRDDSTLNNIHIISSSVPVNMLATRRRTREDILDNPDQFDPQEMGASIRALALSVQDTGMFGDLPKPRIDCRPYAR